MEEISAPLFVFVSYSRADSQFVVRLRADLQIQGVHIWIDKEDIQPGTLDWEEALRAAVRNAQAVLLIASSHARCSSYVKDELRIAKMYQRPIYPVWITGNAWIDVVPLGWGGVQYIDARETRYEMAVQTIVKMLSRAPEQILSSPGVAQSAFDPRNPYKGLRPFAQQDAPDFFGRERLIGELSQALDSSLSEEQQQNARLLAVVGASGSGKSSVVLAGLLPRLQAGMLPESQNWIYLTPIVPGAHPLESLALTFAEKLPERSLRSLCEDLEGDSARGLHLLATALVQQPGAKVVLVVDQFEELFTLTTSEQERRRFIDLLMTALTEHAGPLIVILTMRADFDDRPMCYPELGMFIETHRRSVLSMDLEDLRAVIAKPAALPDVQVTFEGDLVGDLLFEVQGQAGALPLLQFTLDQLFQRRSGRLLTLSDYHEIGGVKGALARHAEATYASLPTDTHRELTRTLFLRLIDPGMTEQDATRRRAPLAELTLPDSDQREMLQETARIFIEARLLLSNTVAGVPIVEVSHEALIREWTQLADWLRASRDDMLLQQTISEDATEWLQRGRPEDRLYRGTQLTEGQSWAVRNQANVAEVAFLQTASEERERTERAEHFRQERELNLQQRVTRRSRHASILTCALLLVILILGWSLFFLQKSMLNNLPVSVTNTLDHGSGSLRAAIADARRGEAVTFAKNLNSPIKLTSGPLEITENLSILGPSTPRLIISGDSGSVFNIAGKATVTLSNLIIEKGYGIINPLYKKSNIYVGGGIANFGTLIVNNCVITHNVANYGGGISNEGTLIIANSTVDHNTVDHSGGGISNPGALTVINSTIDKNDALDGGGINNDGTLTITNSTIDHNIVDRRGGGITDADGSSATIMNDTIADNIAGLGGGGIDNMASASVIYSTISGNRVKTGSGGGISLEKDTLASVPTVSQPKITLSDSIVAGNAASSGPDASGTLTLLYPNLIQHFPDPALNIVYGTASNDSNAKTLAQHSIFGKSPELGPLQNNGGATPTMALASNSPAINRIPPQAKTCSPGPALELSGTNFNHDERDDLRPQAKNGGCDLGAYQHQPTLPKTRTSTPR